MSVDLTPESPPLDLRSDRSEDVLVDEIVIPCGGVIKCRVPVPLVHKGDANACVDGVGLVPTKRF
jgi:hypothetical protein